MNIDTMGLIFGIFSSRFCARFWRMSSLCQVRADTRLKNFVFQSSQLFSLIAYPKLL